jgi:hypothetical protein
MEEDPMRTASRYGDDRIAAVQYDFDGRGVLEILTIVWLREHAAA